MIGDRLETERTGSMYDADVEDAFTSLPFGNC